MPYSEETAADAVARFDTARKRYRDTLLGTDPSAPSIEPPSPWFGIHHARPANVRYQLVHQIEEMARHAGHADIIREQIDGVSVPRIQLGQEGMPPNDFFQPYQPNPGTFGADS